MKNISVKTTQLRILILIFFLGFTTVITAQTGPAGVGNTGGTGGQPKNVLWLDASSLSFADGADLNIWTDLSGNNNNLSQPTAGFTPVFQNDASNLNGHPRAEFSKVNNRIVINPFNDMPISGITSFIIYKTTDSGDGLLSYATGSGTASNEFLLYNNSNLTTYFQANSDNSGVVLNSGNWQFVSHEWQSSNGDLKIYADGDQVRSTVFQSGHSILSGGSLAIGGEQDDVDGGYTSGQAFQGEIAEVIMYNSFLNSAQRLIVENYLSEKYNIGFTTAGNDKFGNDANFNSDYVHNIAGIGKEADGSQTQTSSGGLYLYEWNSTLANGEYVMTAHNNTANNSTTTYTGADLPAGTEASWARQWYLEKTATDGIDVKLIFDFKEALTDGQYPANVSNYVLLYRSAATGSYSVVTVAGQGTLDADQVYFNVADADLQNGYYTIGTTDETGSPVEGISGRTWYALASGDWDNWEYWTLDPAGALPNNPGHETPSSQDKVVIQTGKTITVSSNNKRTAGITVDGILQLGTTTGHNFTEINGGGRIKLSSDNFPLGDAANFITAGQGEGTVVWQGGSYNLSTTHTFFNMEVNLGNSANTLTMLADYTLNGRLTIENGIFQINDNTSATNLNLTVNGNVFVEVNGQILTGSADARHQFNMYGDLTNNGTIKLTNRSTADYAIEATDGIVDANFLSADKNQTVLCNGITNFYRIEIDKGTDITYELLIQASSSGNFNLFGYANQGHPAAAQLTTNNNALGLLRGTVKIGANVNIPVLSTASNYNISESARLLVAGGSVLKNSGNAIVPYGIIEVSSGLLEAKVTSGITTRANGVIKIEGGTINTNQIRTSVFGAANVGGYIQSGGTVNIINPGSTNNSYYHFSMTYPGNVFNMSGGTLHIYDANGTAANQGGIFIASDASNVNVTGGTVIAEIAGTANNFKITSKSPFYNFILRNTYNSTTDHLLDAGTNINGNSDADLPAQPLVVLNDLTIEDNCFLDHNGQDITIGGGFSIAENSQQQGYKNYGLLYDSAKPNTLTFNSDKSDTLYIGHNVDDNYELYLWNMTVNKENGAEIVLKGDPNKDPTQTTLTQEYYNRLINVQGTIDVIRGTFNQGHQSIRLYGPVKVKKNGILGVYIDGTTEITAYVMLKDNDTVLETEDGAQLGNFKLNPQGGAVVSLGSNVYIKRIGYFGGLLNLKNYKLKVDYLHKNSTTTNFGYNNGSTTKMIFSDANASDGGIELYIPGNINTDTDFGLPLGTQTGTVRYTPVRVRITGSTDDGYIQIRPVDGVLQTTNLSGGNILSYYWRIGHSGFTTLPTVRYRFVYDDTDDDAGDEANFIAGKVLDEDPFTRSPQSGTIGNINTGNNRINFNEITLEKANYTAGVANRFTGTVDKYYSYYDFEGGTGNGWYNNWNDANTWDKGSVGSGVHEVPSAGSIVFIQDRARVWGNIIPNIPAGVIFEFNSVEYTNADTENVPRLQFNTSGNFYLGNLSGAGMISINNTANPTVNADFGEWANNSQAYLMYWGGNKTHTAVIQPCPSLMIEGSTQEIDQNIVVNGDFILQSNTNFTPLQNMYIKRNLYIGAWSNGTFHFPGTAPAVEITVDGNIDYTYIHSSGTRDIIVDDPGVVSSLEHKLIIKGSIIHGSDNDYKLNLYNTTDRPAVILELQGETNERYYRTSTSVPNLYRIVLDKGFNQDSSFIFNNSFILNGPTSGAGVSKALELKNGTLILDDAAINIDLNTGNDNFTIPASSCLEVRQGQVNVSGDDTGILLDGKLLISGGTVNMDDLANNGNNYIEYSASGNAELEITGGSLIVGSQIRRGLKSNEGILKYTQTGGTVVIGKNAAPEGKRAVFEILNTGSSFTHSSGSITIVRQQTNPTFASLYLDPETSNLTPGTTITLGNGDTPANQEFGIYSVVSLQNLTLDNTSTNNPKAKMRTVPLTLDGTLLINNGTEFKANGLDLNCYGNFTNYGTFTANQNTTYFKGSTNQTIEGNTTFYNLTDQNTQNLNLNAGNTDIIVENILNLESGTFNDNAGEIKVYGNINNNAVHIYGGTGIEDGISLVGTSQQTMTGSGTYGKLTVNNGNGIVLPVGNTPTISDYLKLEAGVLNIGGNILTLGVNCRIQEANPFGINNMIGTNVSFTDYGVKKMFPSGTGTFTFPVGSVSGAANKYTPAIVTITQNSSSSGYLIVKPADEIHPSIIDDSEGSDPDIVDMDNVLQYYWVLTANGFTDFSGTAEFYYNENDVKVTAPYDVYDYITAKLLNNGTGSWDKYDDISKFDETNKKLIFDYSNVTDADISGDYTAGVDGSTFLGAIPDEVPLYASNGSGGTLDWHTADTWRVDDGTGTWVLPATLGLPEIPYGARVRILAGDRVVTATNYICAYTTEILGTLDVGTTFGNRTGNVTGTGTLYSERGTLPAGYYELFFSASGGTVEFGGTANYSVLSQIAQVNNLTFSGTGNRELPNLHLTILGDVLFSDSGTSSPDIINEFDQTTEIRGDIIYNAGTFDAGVGTDAVVEFAGTSSQTILGTNSFTGTNAFNNLKMNNSSGLTLSRPADIDNNLIFTTGVIHTTTTDILTLENTNETIVSGAGTDSYVDGPLNKNIIIGGKFLFPTGNSTRYGYIILDNVSSSDYWQSEYYNHNPGNDGYNPANFLAPIKVVSENEFWRINGPASSSSYVELRWDAVSGVSSDATERNDLRVAEWISGNNRWEESHSTATASGTALSGTVTTNPSSPALNGNHIFTLTSQLLITNTWEGNNSTAWSDAGNWSAGTVPTGSSDAIIPTNPIGNRFPEIDIAAHCHKLEIQNSATVTINAAKSLTLNSDFTNDGILILKSPSNETASASFIDNGTITGTGTIHVERWFSANKFHYVSSPIQAGGNAGSDLFTQSNSSGNFNPNFYIYDETFDLDGNAGTAPSGAFNSDNLVPGWAYAYLDQTTNNPMETKTGYAFYTDENQLITFIGKPNTGNITVSGLTYTNNDPINGTLPNYYDGWNLVANPYPSAVDWDLIKSSRTNLDDAIYVWDGTQYASYAGGVKGGSSHLSNEIAPMQAFFVHATANSASFSLQNSNRVHSSQNYLKSPDTNNTKEDIPNFIRLKMQANGYSDYTVVYFKPNASSQFDGNFDALKLFSNITSVPHIYSTIQNEQTPLSINVLPENNMRNLIIPLSVKIGQAGTYTISADKFNFENTHVYFIDKQENAEIYLNENSLENYSFYCNAGILSDRFELHFYKNNAPAVLDKINDTNVFEDQAFNFTLPKNSFIETDKNDKISGYYAKLENGNDLPEWLTFNNQTLSFSGVPENKDVGILTIKVYAFDKMGATGYQEFNLSVINTNDAPFAENSIPDMETYITELYTYTIPNNIFYDVDLGDILTYSAQLENGTELPDWLNFNSDTKTFSGIPETSDIYQIEVKATDIAGANTSDIYTLTVKGSSDISNVSESDFNIYPNPTRGKFFIVNSKPAELHYIVTNITGSIIKEAKTFTNKEEVDLTGFGAGIYFVKIQNETETLSFKVILQK